MAATDIQKLLNLPPAQERKENLEKLDLFRVRCLSIVSILKSEFNALEKDAPLLVYTWYHQNLLQIQQSGVGFQQHQSIFNNFIKALIKIHSDLNKEIESTRSLEELYDFLYGSLLQVKYFRDEQYAVTKAYFLKHAPTTDQKGLDENLRKSLSYTYCTQMMGAYEEMLNLIAPAIEERQMAYWLNTSVTITPIAERIRTKKWSIIYKTRLATPLEVFMGDFKEFSDHLDQVKIEHAEFSPLVEATKEKMKALYAVVEKLCKERAEIGASAKAKGTFIPIEDTRKTFYTIIEFTDLLTDIRREFEFESIIFEKKLKLEKLQAKPKPKVVIAAESTAKELKVREEVRATQGKDEKKSAEEEFLTFEENERKKHAEYKAEVLQKRKEKERLKQTLKEQIKAGKILPESLSKTVMEGLKTCGPDELQIIQDVMKHSAIAERPLHVVLIKLGFSADKLSSQGYNYKIGPFSAAYHPAHASSAFAGQLHPDFVSKLRKIFWGLGFDKGLIASFQRQLDFKAQNANKKDRGKRI